MAKGARSAKPKIAIDPDPNRCFVYFPKNYLTAGTAVVGLESILRQVQKQDSERNIKTLYLDESDRKLVIEFERGGDPV